MVRCGCGAQTFGPGRGWSAIRQVLHIGLLALVTCACLAWLGVRLRGRHFRGRAAARRLLSAVLLAAWAAVAFWLTLGSRTARPEPSANTELLWSYRESLVLFGESPRVSNSSLLAEIVLNALLFVPLGALLPFAWPARLRGLRGAVLVAAIGACASLAIELSQLLFHLGLFEFDDVLNNTLGAVARYAAYSLLSALAVWITRRSSAS